MRKVKRADGSCTNFVSGCFREKRKCLTFLSLVVISCYLQQLIYEVTAKFDNCCEGRKVVGAPPFTHMPIVFDSSRHERDCPMLTLTASIHCLLLSSWYKSQMIKYFRDSDFGRRPLDAHHLRIFYLGAAPKFVYMRTAHFKYF